RGFPNCVQIPAQPILDFSFNQPHASGQSSAPVLPVFQVPCFWVDVACCRIWNTDRAHLDRVLPWC
ncbi:MAG TPA: hypothetical protein PLU80_08685, partial [Acidobacteriota bacterium]|nr:hypothetical protein [Acidobacteriota bacterium]